MTGKEKTGGNDAARDNGIASVKSNAPDATVDDQTV
jgi:uncharacterized protein YegP (UPF0339 family)